MNIHSGWYVYIVLCKGNVYYTGVTNNLKKRVDAHNSGKGAKFTRGRTPVSIVYSNEIGSLSDALIEESRIKKLSRKQKISLISSYNIF